MRPGGRRDAARGCFARPGARSRPRFRREIARDSGYNPSSGRRGAMSQYNPYQSPNQYVPGFAPVARRSPIPKVIGILMIIFGGLALLSNLVGQVMPQDPNFGSLPEWREFDRV